MTVFTRIRFTFITMLFATLGLLTACGGGGGGDGGNTLPSNAKPAGYYTGTITTVSPAQSNLAVQAISDTDKLLLVHIDNGSPQNTILYVITFTEMTASTFKADVCIYYNGEFKRMATITNGSIIERSSISGTLSGTGDYTSTSFSLTYDTTINARSSFIVNDKGTWVVPGTTATGLRIVAASPPNPAFLSNNYDDISIVPYALRGCGKSINLRTDVVSEQVGRIQKYSTLYSGGTAGSGCVNFTSDFTITGYFTSFDNTNPDDRVLWISYDDNVSFAAELVKQ